MATVIAPKITVRPFSPTAAPLPGYVVKLKRKQKKRSVCPALSSVLLCISFILKGWLPSRKLFEA